ncbi:MAG: hypothetical protein LC708_03445, partial [Actinobacteria bacterium]|nr:hypothetical protein [Actinomycetota bacterium]
MRDLVAATTTRVSDASTGAQADGPSNSPTVSADGAVVPFASVATASVAGAARVPHAAPMFSPMFRPSGRRAARARNHWRGGWEI